jgi:hypothetical protein
VLRLRSYMFEFAHYQLAKCSAARPAPCPEVRDISTISEFPQGQFSLVVTAGTVHGSGRTLRSKWLTGEATPWYSSWTPGPGRELCVIYFRSGNDGELVVPAVGDSLADIRR